MLKKFHPITNQRQKESTITQQTTDNLHAQMSLGRISFLQTGGRIRHRLPESSTSSDQTTICHICLQTQSSSKNLIWPCRCELPMHTNCFQEWIVNHQKRMQKKSSYLKCYICKENYTIQIGKRYIIQWKKICQPSVYRILEFFVFTFLLGTTIFLINLYHKQKSHSTPLNSDRIPKDIAQNGQGQNKDLSFIILLLILILTALILLLCFWFFKKYLLGTISFIKSAKNVFKNAHQKNRRLSNIIENS